jgi:hypothetical protein
MWNPTVEILYTCAAIASYCFGGKTGLGTAACIIGVWELYQIWKTL